MDSTLVRLHRAGQSVWYDNIRRGLLDDGELARLVAQGVRGVTSNPTIFEKAIDGSDDYDDAIRSFPRDASLDALYDDLVRDDIRRAADILRPVYDASDGADGFVSVEVAPHLAHDADGTVAEALRLRALVDRPNVMIKVPATPEGAMAIRRLIEQGVHVNVTLIFSIAQYDRVIEAYLGGLEARAAAGLPIDRIASVASFFVSRVDTAVDKALSAIASGGPEGAREEARSLLGTAAVGNARLAYARFQERFGDARFARLRERGARVQRPLWASTGTKNQAYSDVLYVDSLVGPDTVNTMPPDTLKAVLDHGRSEETVTREVDTARRRIDDLAAVGVDLAAVTEDLQRDGVRAFADSFEALMTGLMHKRRRLAGGPPEARYALGEVADAVEAAVADLSGKGAPRRLWAKDGTLWSGDPATARFIPTAMGWLDAPAAMRPQLPAFAELARACAADGFTTAVVLGMGGSSLAPDLFAHTFAAAAGGLALHVLDSTHPQAVEALCGEIDLARTLFLVSSKSGTTTEPNAFYRYFRARVAATVGDSAAGRHFVAITDPGTALESLAHREGMRAVVAGLADVGGRYSALTPFGLVPAALLGVDTEELVRRGLVMAADSGPSVPVAHNPGAYLGAVLGAAGRAGRDKVTLVTEGPVALLGDWLEQLLAESTGKEGRGLIPVVGEPLGDVDTYGDDRLFVHVAVGEGSEPVERRLAALEAAGHPVVRIALADALDLGGEFVRWEVATAIAGAVLGVDPFDQPNVQESKDNTHAAIAAFHRDGRLDEPAARADAQDGIAVTVGTGAGSGGADGALEAFLAALRPGDYVAFMAYVPPSTEADAAVRSMREAVRRHRHVATTFGYGPRFLHSTGQLHKGGPATGAFVQIVQAPTTDPAVPSMDLGFGTLVRAQALGDLEALEKRGRRLVRLETRDGSALVALAGRLERAARTAATATPARPS